MKRSARTSLGGSAADILGSAFAARKQAAPEKPPSNAATSRVENGDEEMDVEVQVSEDIDGVSGKEISFTNSFELLHSAPAVQMQSTKKTKTNIAAQLVCLQDFVG